VESAHTLRLNWYGPGDSGARAWFSRIYKETRLAIEAGDRPKADALLAPLKTRTFYESANLALLRYEYVRRWGTEAEQLGSVRHALISDQAETYLGKDTHLKALQTCLALEVRTALRTDPTAYTVPGEITTGNSWPYKLFKRQFRIRIASGSITAVKLWCDQKYLRFMFDPSLQYTVSGADNCNMELFGEPGTRFELTQL
jgi:hypothetical protein